MKRVVPAVFACLFALLAFSGCGAKHALSDIVSISQSADSLGSSIGPKEFFATMTELTVEVAYEPGAEPYAGTSAKGKPNWDLLESNLNALFENRSLKPHVTVPKTLGEMLQIPAQSKTSWTAQDIVDLAGRHRITSSTTTTGYFWIVFLNGHFNQNGMDNASTIGVSVNGTTIIAIFKDVIEAVSPNAAVAVYVEQSTVIHEVGHALGLVNNGIPTTSDHHDSAHTGHCKNPDCVMYWMNEGAADLKAFAQKLMATGSSTMFGQECLDDATNFHP